MINPAHCAFMRALLEWFHSRGFISHGERNGIAASLRMWEQRIATCLGKHPFDTFTAANKVAQRNRTDSTRIYDAYQCGVCQKFHVGAARMTLKRHRIKHRRQRDEQELADA